MPVLTIPVLTMPVLTMPVLTAFGGKLIPRGLLKKLILRVSRRKMAQDIETCCAQINIYARPSGYATLFNSPPDQFLIRLTVNDADPRQHAGHDGLAPDDPDVTQGGDLRPFLPVRHCARTHGASMACPEGLFRGPAQARATAARPSRDADLSRGWP